MQQPVYVVGYGMIDALGNNPTQCWTNMVSGEDYSQDIPDLVDEQYKIYRGYPVTEQIVLPDNFSLKVSPTLTKSQKMAIHATNQALAMSQLPHSSNVAVIVSTVSNDVEDGPEIFTKVMSNKRNNPRRLVNRIPDMAPSHICSHFKFNGHAVAVYSSCSTGMTSIDYGMYLADEYDYVIVGGSDAGCNSLAMKYFAQIGALANESIPFDPNRKGFVMGEGAGILILQSEKKVAEYGSTVHAKLYPSGKANDATDMTSPAPDGIGERIAILQALQKSKTDPDFVCGHATATPVGDPIEYKAIVDTAGIVPTWAPKSMIGHTLAASGALETIYSILSMKNYMLPGIARTQNFEDEMNMLVKVNTQIRKNGTLTTLNNSFGFGGKCMAQIIEV
jgi:3-oxoacyl-[acyl-carrier-protein] synthase II